jgi:hypothetical protein
MITQYEDQLTNKTVTNVTLSTFQARVIQHKTTFHLGDVVSLRGASDVLMTIGSFVDQPNAHELLAAECYWFTDNNMLNQAVIPLSALIVEFSNENAHT